MTGKITVDRTTDWLTPYEVTVTDEAGKSTTANFMSGAKAQLYALARHDATGYPLVYLCDSGVPTNKGTFDSQSRQRDFPNRYHRICAKCRQARPLREFAPIMHRNRQRPRSKPVFHGYAEKCQACVEGREVAA